MRDDTSIRFRKWFKSFPEFQIFPVFMTLRYLLFGLHEDLEGDGVFIHPSYASTPIHTPSIVRSRPRRCFIVSSHDSSGFYVIVLFMFTVWFPSLFRGRKSSCRLSYTENGNGKRMVFVFHVLLPSTYLRSGLMRHQV